MAGRMTPEQAAERGRLGGLAKSARHYGGDGTAKARASWQEKFLQEVDPDGLLTPEERSRRAAVAQKAHMAKLQMLSAESRRAKKAKGELEDQLYESIVVEARRRNDVRDKIDKGHGFATPVEVDEKVYLNTLESALEAGVRLKDWGCVAEAIAMIRQRTGRL